jgi:hypothetical protein
MGNNNCPTAEQFYAYEAVRLSGKTNMFDYSYANMLSEVYANENLPKNIYLDIIKNYSFYKDKYMPFTEWVSSVASEIQEYE